MSKVTLSKTTLDVLKNFSTINSSIVFRQGSTVRTISNAENILAKFTGEEIFPTDFAIYDLSQFLSGISLFDNQSIEFTSGAGGLFKSGIPIGKIQKDPINSKTTVTFFSDFSQLRYVKMISFTGDTE